MTWETAAPYILGTAAAAWLLYVAWAMLRRPKKVEEPRKKTFLEEALDADPVRPTRSYSWSEFQADLHDGTKSFEEIYEKYGGVFPKKPEDPPPAAVQPAMGFYQEPTPGLRGADGPSGLNGASGQSGVGGPKGPEGRCPTEEDPRMKELQAWFKARGEDVPVKKLVPPPPAPHTVIHKIYTRGRR